MVLLYDKESVGFFPRRGVVGTRPTAHLHSIFYIHIFGKFYFLEFDDFGFINSIAIG